MSIPVYITSAAAWIPPAESAKEAIAAGRYPAEDSSLNDIPCLPVATDEISVPDMGVIAGRRALDRAAGVVGDQVDLIVHASIYHQGRDHHWNSAPYIQRELGITDAFAVNIEGMSNGGMAAFDLAMAQIEAGRATSAMVTTADRFCPPGFDRWRGSYGIVFGDGSTAMVLSRTGGFARVHAIASLTDASLEPLHRGTDPFTNAYGVVVDENLRTAKKSYLEEVGRESVLKRAEEALLAVVRSVLEKTGHRLDDFAKILLPNMGNLLMQVQFFHPLGIPAERTLWNWGRHTGHLGAGDLTAGLARLVEKKEVSPGDHVLLVGAGGGYSLTAAVVEIESVPDWTEVTTDFALPSDVTE
ncbi:ketoacyl-ACP synthase III family protein [Streptomyces sp. PKU-EA00015]|uniref:ketoacyl-ACP synthase III family protein n=1 Tax=Streptomyces sp. PKU-EA00015 TaxID=2748326 RepID=UPI0015A0FB98|nr:ketoacyl-ACP synthase III family protein [Streptomyces sp. PKU-EA00015]NWF30239.1 ketoacyl-ACP synthase III family protein [Streptomyces sp. PKU-EA00015]